MRRKRAAATLAVALVGVAALVAWWRGARPEARDRRQAVDGSAVRVERAPGDGVVIDGRPRESPRGDAGLETRADEVARVLCVPRAEILCDAAEHCGCGLDRDTCIRRATERCGRQPSRVSLDPADVERCLALYRENAGTCFPRIHCDHEADAAALGDRCSIGGRICAGGAGVCEDQTCIAIVPSGGACDYDEQCAPDASCRRGVCARWDATGTACERDDDCGPTTMCREGRCVEHRAAGAACERRADCLPSDMCVGGVCRAASACTRDENCGTQARCDRGIVHARCEPRRRVGEPCLQDECGAETTCDRLRDECVVLPGEGERCRDRQCATGLMCDRSTDDPVCVPALTVGEPCGADGPAGIRPCGVGLTCVETNDLQRCAHGGSLGGLCAPGGTCEPGARCTAGRCTLARGPCEDNDLECPSGHRCVDGRCVPPLQIGERGCESLECAPPGLCVDDRCVAPPGLGEDCMDACADGLACVEEHVGGHCIPVACDSML